MVIQPIIEIQFEPLPPFLLPFLPPQPDQQVLDEEIAAIHLMMEEVNIDDIGDDEVIEFEVDEDGMILND